MPSALQRVERAAKLLEEASALLKDDPYSQPARKKLIEGARGLTSSYTLIATNCSFDFRYTSGNLFFVIVFR